MATRAGPTPAYLRKAAGPAQGGQPRSHSIKEAHSDNSRSNVQVCQGRIQRNKAAHSPAQTKQQRRQPHIQPKENPATTSGLKYSRGMAVVRWDSSGPLVLSWP